MHKALRNTSLMILAIGTASLLACNHKEAQQPIQATAIAGLQSDAPSPHHGQANDSQRAVYAAENYDKPGHPPLTPEQKETIRKTLALVKPCQRGLLAYAFPENADFLPMVLFFRGNGHVFGQRNVYYNESQGLAKAYPAGGSVPSSDVHYDIEHTPCAQ
jgi:hypothetical protein